MTKIGRYLKIDWFILCKDKIFWSSMLLALCAQIVFPYMIHTFSVGGDEIKYNLIKLAFSFPNVYNTVTVINLLPFQIVSFYCIMLVCNSYEMNHNRIFLLAGYSRLDLWKSRIVLILCLSIIFTFVAFVVSLMVGIINEKTLLIDFAFDDIKTFVVYFIQVITYLSYAIVLSLIIRRTGLTIVAYLLYFGLIDRTLTQIINHWFHLKPIGNYLPGKSVELLNVLEVYKQYTIHHKFDQINKYVIVMVWLGFSMILSLWLYKKNKV